MDELIQADMKEVNDYIEIQYTILALQAMMRTKGKESFKVMERVEKNIKKFTKYQDENFALTKDKIETVLELSLIHI